MKKRMISFLVALPMLLSMTGLFAYAVEEDAGIVVYQQTFEDMLDSKGGGLTGDNIKKRDTTFTSVGTNDTSKTTVAVTAPQDVLMTETFEEGTTDLPAEKGFSFENTTEPSAEMSFAEGILKLDKEVASPKDKTPKLRLKLTDMTTEVYSYSVSFDLRQSIKNSTLNIYVGGGISVRNAAESKAIPEEERPQSDENKYVIEWWDVDKNAWDTTSATIYDLSDFASVRFHVKEKKLIDVYIDDQKVLSNLKQRTGYNIDELRMDLGTSMLGVVEVDNFVVTRGGFAYHPSEPLPVSENHVFRLKKLAAGSSTTKMNLAPYLCGSKDYTYSFDLQLNAGSGSSFNLNLGACVQIAQNADVGGFKVLAHKGGSLSGDVANFEQVGSYPFDTLTNIALRVKTETKTTDVYVNGELLKAGIPQRAAYPLTEMQLITNNGLRGEILLDNFTLTLHDVGAVTTTTTNNDAQIDFENFTPGVFQTGTGGFTADNTPAVGLISVADAPEDTEGTAAAHGKALRLYSPIVGNSNYPAVYNLSRSYAHLLDGALEYTTSFDLLLTGDQSYNIAERSSGSGGFKLNFDLAQGILIKYQIMNQENAPEWITSDKKFTPNTWFNVKYVVNTQSETADVYYNGDLLAEDLPAIYGSPFGGLVISTNNGTAGELWLDNFSMTVDKKAVQDSSISGKLEGGSLNLSAYVPEGISDAQAFVAYYNADGMLVDAAVRDCAAGENLEESFPVPAGNEVTEIRLFLWSDLNPLCGADTISVTQQ